jgi:hypothetical protein
VFSHLRHDDRTGDSTAVAETKGNMLNSLMAGLMGRFAP